MSSSPGRLVILLVERFGPREGRRHLVLVGVALLVAAVGLWQLADGVAGGRPSWLARLFYDAEAAEALAGEAAGKTGPFVKVCGDGSLLDHFESVSARRLAAWCEGVARFQDDRDGPAAVTLLRASNLHFERVIEKLHSAGGPAARLGLEAMEAACEVKPLLEKANSLVAGAFFSQALLGLVLLVAGGIAARRGALRRARGTQQGRWR